MELKFSSLDEVKDFVKQFKSTRGGKDKDPDDTGTAVQLPGGAPAPLMPPQQQPFQPQFNPTGTQAGPTPFQPQPQFNPTGTQAGPTPFQPQPQFNPAAAVQGVDPQVASLVQRLAAKIDAVIAGGQPADQALQWFRTQCGAGAENATLDQIKQHFLFRLPLPTLTDMAKLMAA